MTTITVTLTSKHLHYLDELVSDGLGMNRADVMRMALERLIEEVEITAIMSAAFDGPLGDDLREFFDRHSDTDDESE